jgi:hypothetical protein
MENFNRILNFQLKINEKEKDLNLITIENLSNQISTTKLEEYNLNKRNSIEILTLFEKNLINSKIKIKELSYNI